ncbi:MAG: (Fe-S)-binding protein [Mycobacterium leprae]
MQTALQEALFRCNKCGSCTATCPLYEQTKQEGMAARGKLALVEAALEGNLPVTPALRDRLSDCLLCGACKVSCPSAVPTTAIFEAARAEVAEKLGLPLWQKAFLFALDSPSLLGVATRTGGLVQQTGLLSFAPPIARCPYRSRRLPNLTGEQAKATVAFFVGCLMNTVYADVAEATHRVLVHNGYRVETPAVGCCGMPNRGMGDREGARRLARQNIDALARYETVVTDCATCGSALKEYGALLADDPAYAERAKGLAGRVYDIAEFLVRFGYEPPAGELPVRVTYHESCHLGREQKVKAQPRQLLRSIPGLDFVEMSGADACCGGGGSFAFTHPELGRQVGAAKGESIEATGAPIVATGCPGCSVQLRNLLRHQGSTAVVRHPVQLLATSYGRMATIPSGSIIS